MQHFLILDFVAGSCWQGIPFLEDLLQTDTFVVDVNVEEQVDTPGSHLMKTVRTNKFKWFNPKLEYPFWEKKKKKQEQNPNKTALSYPSHVSAPALIPAFALCPARYPMMDKESQRNRRWTDNSFVSFACRPFFLTTSFFPKFLLRDFLWMDSVGHLLPLLHILAGTPFSHDVKNKLEIENQMSLALFQWSWKRKFPYCLSWFRERPDSKDEKGLSKHPLFFCGVDSSPFMSSRLKVKIRIRARHNVMVRDKPGP